MVISLQLAGTDGVSGSCAQDKLNAAAREIMQALTGLHGPGARQSPAQTRVA